MGVGSKISNAPSSISAFKVIHLPGIRSHWQNSKDWHLKRHASSLDCSGRWSFPVTAMLKERRLFLLQDVHIGYSWNGRETQKSAILPLYMLFTLFQVCFLPFVPTELQPFKRHFYVTISFVSLGYLWMLPLGLLLSQTCTCLYACVLAKLRALKSSTAELNCFHFISYQFLRIPKAALWTPVIVFFLWYSLGLCWVL